jgi:hypothetical protein
MRNVRNIIQRLAMENPLDQVRVRDIIESDSNTIDLARRHKRFTLLGCDFGVKEDFSILDVGSV